MSNLEQVFFYITHECNIGCITCYLKKLPKVSNLCFEEKLKLLELFRKQGAWRLTLLGGEPTDYCQLGTLIAKTREMGYNFIRINTNGMFDSLILENQNIKKADVICFSIDGPSALINDNIRLGGKLDIVLENMRYARKLGYDVRVNSTITSLNIDYVHDMIELAQASGASEINLNVVIMMGKALENSYIEVNPHKWMEIYNKVLQNHKQYSIRIKIPAGFSSIEDLKTHRKLGHRCLALEKSRVYVLSNGDTYPCIIFIGSPEYRVGTYEYGSFTQLKSYLGNDNLYCKYQQTSDSNYHPLCIFYKDRLNYEPDQPNQAV